VSSNFFNGTVSGDVAIRNTTGCNIHIGRGVASPTMTLDSNANVGIGTLTPSTKLDVVGIFRVSPSNDPNVTSVILDSSGQTNGKKWALFSTHNTATEGAGKLMFQQNTNGINAMVIDSSGNVGIGTTAPSYKLHVSGQIYATGDIVAFSDLRYKQDLQVIVNPLDKVQNLTGYTYTMTTATEKEDVTKLTPRYVGLIAQDLEKVLPEAVHKDPDGKMSVAYGNLAGLFVESIKELTEENKQLKEQLSTMQTRIEALESKLESVLNVL
jgi:hypothetical protein